MRALVYRPLAVKDLDDIHAFIAENSPERAQSFVDQIRAHCRILLDYPELGRRRDDLGLGIRLFPMRRRVMVAYRIRSESIEITRLFYRGRNYEAILRGRPDAP